MFFFDVVLGYKRKKTCKYCKSLLVGWNMGFEPMTFGTTIRRSNQLS